MNITIGIELVMQLLHALNATVKMTSDCIHEQK